MPLDYFYPLTINYIDKEKPSTMYVLRNFDLNHIIGSKHRTVFTEKIYDINAVFTKVLKRTDFSPIFMHSLYHKDSDGAISNASFLHTKKSYQPLSNAMQGVPSEHSTMPSEHSTMPLDYFYPLTINYIDKEKPSTMYVLRNFDLNHIIGSKHRTVFTEKIYDINAVFTKVLKRTDFSPIFMYSLYHKDSDGAISNASFLHTKKSYQPLSNAMQGDRRSGKQRALQR